MNIVFARTDMYGGVTEGGSFSLINGFLSGANALGHATSIVSSGPIAPPPGTALHVIPYSRGFWDVPELPTIAYGYRFIRRVAPIFEKTPPDFVYLRHTAFNIAAALLKRELGVKVILQCDGSEVWVKKTWGKLYFERILRWAEEIEFAAADGMTAISDEVRAQLVAAGAPPEAILVNPNGADPEKFSPDVSGDAVRERYGLQGAFVCGFSGSFDVMHGVTVFAEAMRFAKAALPEAKFMFIGDGKMRAAVEEIARKTGMERDTILTGMAPFDEVPRYLAACDALVLPSVHNADGSEFFCSPIKLFEYMAMQKPIVASGIGQIASVLRHGENALLVEPNAPERLAEELVALARAPERAEELARQARKDAVERYTWRMNARRVIDFAASRP